MLKYKIFAFETTYKDYLENIKTTCDKIQDFIRYEIQPNSVLTIAPIDGSTGVFGYIVWYWEIKKYA